MIILAELSVFTVSTLFTAIFFIFSLNSLLLFSIIRRKVYLAYALLVLGLAAHVSLPLFRQEHYDLVAGISVITAMITTLGSLWFSQTFVGFSLRHHHQWFKVYRLTGTFVVGVISVQLSNVIVLGSDILSDYLSYAAALLTLFSLLLNFAMSFALWRKEAMARLYFYINLPMIFSAISYVIIWLFWDSERSDQTTWIVLFIYCGMTLQMILFSVFIAVKIKQAEKERLFLEQNINNQLKKEVESQTQSLKRAMRKVENQKDELQKLNNLKNKLFSLVAHDLRNPMNNLSSLLELTEHHELEGDQLRTFSEKTRKDLSQSMMVMERLLYWSSKQLEGIKIQKESIILSELLDDIVKELKPQIKEKHIQLEILINENEVYFDRVMMRVCLRNLLSNSIKFSHEKGRITISTHFVAGLIRISLRDEGLGMDADWFNKFRQEGKPDVKQGTKGEKGTGFGLLITKDFVEMNGGELICESEPGQGTTFIMEGSFKPIPSESDRIEGDEE